VATSSPTATETETPTATESPTATASDTGSTFAAKSTSPRIGIVCVWTSRSPSGKAQKIFRSGLAVYLIAAWHTGSISNPDRYHLRVRWTGYSGYQSDVSLAPLDQNRIAVATLKDPIAPSAGTYRLAKAPRLQQLPSGWYSVVAQAFLTGPGCSRDGCTGPTRQNRFQVH